MGNEMPKLEPGMAVKLKWSHLADSEDIYMMVRSDYYLNMSKIDSYASGLHGADIVEVYVVERRCPYELYTKNLKPIWKKEEEPKTRPMTNEELIDLWYDEPKLKVRIRKHGSVTKIRSVREGDTCPFHIFDGYYKAESIDSYTTDGKTWKKLEVEV